MERGRYQRRVELRCRGRGGQRSGAAGTGHRRRCIDPPARGLQRHRRAEADARGDSAQPGARRLRQLHPSRIDGAQRRRRRADARCGQRRARQRSALDRARPHAGGGCAACRRRSVRQAGRRAAPRRQSQARPYGRGSTRRSGTHHGRHGGAGVGNRLHPRQPRAGVACPAANELGGTLCRATRQDPRQHRPQLCPGDRRRRGAVRPGTAARDPETHRAVSCRAGLVSRDGFGSQPGDEPSATGREPRRARADHHRR